jgi:hypothetical protein
MTTAHGQRRYDLQRRIHVVMRAYLNGHITSAECMALVRPLEWLMQHQTNQTPKGDDHGTPNRL